MLTTSKMSKLNSKEPLTSSDSSSKMDMEHSIVQTEHTDDNILILHFNSSFLHNSNLKYNEIKLSCNHLPLVNS